MSVLLKGPILVGMAISVEMEFQICAPDLMMKLSAILVLTRGILIRFALLVGYRWKSLLSLKNLSNVEGSKEFLYLYMKVAAV